MRAPFAILCVALLCSASAAFAATDDSKEIKNGLVPADYVYRMPEGVTRREVTYFSDGMPCYAMLFFPKGFSPSAASSQWSSTIAVGVGATASSR